MRGKMVGGKKKVKAQGGRRAGGTGILPSRRNLFGWLSGLHRVGILEVQHNRQTDPEEERKD